MSERTLKLRDEIINTVPIVCPERARIFTREMRASVGRPIVLRRAYAFARVLDEMSIYVRDGELLVGNTAGRPRGAAVFPEYSVRWILDELDGNPYPLDKRPNDIYDCSSETEKELREILDYWSDKTLHDNLRTLIPEDAKAAWDIAAIDDDWVTQNGLGNILPDYQELLEEGLGARMKRAETLMESLDLTKPGNAVKKWFLEAVIVTNRAVINFANRYADKLAGLAEAENDPKRKGELEAMSRNCRRVPEHRPENLWEALQAVFFIHACIQIETNGIAISFGRFDQFLWPYFSSDIEKGKINRDTALELIENFLIKINEINIFRSWEGAKFFPGYHMAINLVLGGQTRDGRDAVNELSFLVLDATANMRLPKPSVSVKWFEGTSDDFVGRALEVVQAHKGGQPAFYNDLGVIRLLKNMGVKDDDAWNWAPVGCVEASVPGKWDFACKGARLNIAKILEMTLHNGKDPVSGVTVLPGDGDLGTFGSMSDVMKAFKRQLHFFMEKQVEIEHMNDEMHILHDINAFRSSLFSSCIERGKSLIEGGAVYSTDGGPTVGAITASDSLAAIDAAVFRNKWFTGEQLLHAIDTNYEDSSTSPKGEEIRLKLQNKIPKFGNDDDIADRWAIAVTEFIGSTYQTEFKNSRYGKGPDFAIYGFSQSSVTANVAFGKGILALPNGRKAGEPVNNGVSPATGAEKNGLLATINSVSKLPSIWFQKGAIFNVRLSEDILTSEEGRMRINGIIRTFFENYQYHIQFNVFKESILRDAQIHPENYSDLMVRVAGYSAFFAPLNEELQEDIIRRSKLD